MIKNNGAFENELEEMISGMLAEYMLNGWRLMHGCSDCFKVYHKRECVSVLVSIKRKRLQQPNVEEVRLVKETYIKGVYCDEVEILKYYKNSRYAADSLEELNGIKFLF